MLALGEPTNDFDNEIYLNKFYFEVATFFLSKKKFFFPLEIFKCLKANIL